MLHEADSATDLPFTLPSEADFDASNADFDASNADFDASDADFDASDADFDASDVNFDASDAHFDASSTNASDAHFGASDEDFNMNPAYPAYIQRQSCLYPASILLIPRITLPVSSLYLLISCRSLLPKFQYGGWPCTALRAQYGQPLAG